MERILYRRNFTNPHAKRWIRYLVPCAVIVFFMVFSFVVSSEDTVFGPKTYTRTSGPSNVFQDSFSITDVNSSFTVIVKNGDAAGGRLSSAKIVLNGAEIVKPSDFNQQVQEIRRTVVLRKNNTLRVELQSKPGSFITISIVRNPLPVLSITSPLSGTVFRSQPITVEGTIDIPSAQVTVNGVPAAVNGGRFVAQNVPLIRDGMNTITAIGTAPGGNTGQASVMVILDTMAPNIVIDSPANGFVTPDNTISVSGMVSDVITPNPTVVVNDVPATVTNGTFLAMGVPLNMGDNQITATARDGVGNQSTASITVNRADLPGLRLRIISGQAQTALIKSSLPEPLRVKLVDATDNAIANREVLFQVSRGDGSLRNAPPLPGQTGQRTLILNTDGNGEAAVRFDLGSRSGPGNNRVQASVVGGLSPVEFSATATSGAPDRIAIVPMSNQQTGIVNQPLGMPLACVVVDASGNPVAGVPVTFQVTEGGGNFGGNPSFVEATGADGVAHALLTLGPEPGTQNNAVAAAFQGQTDPPINFAASGRVPGLLGNTTFSGLVLDNGDLPLRNARAVIFGTDRSAVTDATGRFLITNVPPGAQRLLIDGSGIVDSQGRIFPGLEFDLNVISGIENSLAMPIYLPPLSTDPQSVARITGPVTTSVTLQMPGIPQATLTLLAGTVVSNHNGPASAGNPITVRLSRVNNDRVPMPPPNGSVFTLAGTVQPSGTHFSIPARVCSPNTGLPPGAQVDIFSFDHDVGQFLSIGFATVSEDGSMVCSNPGFGINKAGWFGATPPPPPTTDAKNCRVTLSANPNPGCIEEEIVITATTDPSGKTVTWGGDLGNNPQISGNVLRTRYSTEGEKTVTATCEQSSQSVTVKIVKVASVQLEAINSPLSNNPGAGGGQRIFADQDSPADTSERRTVRVKATITPAMANVKVFFRVFDLDDPSTDADIDSNGATGDDNRADGTATPNAGKLSAVSATTNASGEATVDLTVSRQPGNNFAVSATCNENYSNGLRLKASDGSIIEDSSGNALPTAQGQRTEMLTVWRRLHIERDSMVAVPTSGNQSNKVTGNVDGITGTATEARTVTLSVNLKTGLASGADSSTNLSDTPAGNGRFEKAKSFKVGVGAGSPGQTDTTALEGNGDNFVRKTTGGGINIPFSITKTGQGAVSGKVVGFDKASRVFTLNITAGTLVANHVAGTLNVTGVTMTISVVDAANKKVTVNALTDIPFELLDDDSFVLPELPNLDVTNSSYKDAYIEVVDDGGGAAANNKQTVAFILNIDFTNQALKDAMNQANGIESDANRKDNFWVGYVLNAYQTRTTGDIDPNAETSDGAASSGQTPSVAPALGSVIFPEMQVEFIRIFSLGGSATQHRSNTVAHEIGHQFDLDHLNGLIMGAFGSGATTFHPKDIAKLRARITSPGK